VDGTATIGWVKPGAVDLKIQHVFRMLPQGWNISILTTMWGLQMNKPRELRRRGLRRPA